MRVLWLGVLLSACSFDTGGVGGEPGDADPTAIDAASRDASMNPDAEPGTPDAEIPDAAVGMVSHQESQVGTSTAASVVTVDVGGGSSATWLAAVTQVPYQEVDSVNGLGATWTRVASRCSAENSTGVDVWKATGTLNGGTVSASLGQTASAAVIAVSRYDGVTAIGTTATLNLDVTCNSTNNEANFYSTPVDPIGLAGLVYAAVGHRDNTHTAGTELVERGEVHIQGGALTAGLSISDRQIDGEDVVVVDGNFNGLEDWGLVVVELRP